MGWWNTTSVHVEHCTLSLQVKKWNKLLGIWSGSKDHVPAAGICCVSSDT